MFTAPTRPLPFPLDRSVELTVTTPEGEEVCGLPAFPEDSDEKITVLFRLSLNEFVALASAVDAGVDPAFGADAQKVWWLWAASVMCAAFCEEMAECLTTGNEAVINALAEQLRSNPILMQALSDALVEQGGGTPGQEISEEQSGSDLLPENVKPDDICDFDALWGGMLYLVQSGNRAITDFLEVLEAASNTLEAMALAAGQIPAAGNNVSAAFDFANAIQEFFAENYAANYSEGYEQQLACDLFCQARGDCELSIDDMINVINARFPEPFDVVTFSAIMVRIGTGSVPGNFVGPAICDAMFLLYFTSLKFGQQFGDTIGLRPLPVIISLGADQLASDNWETLCDCPVICDSFDFRDSAFTGQWHIRLNTTSEDMSEYVATVGYTPREQSLGGFQNQIYTISSLGCSTLEYVYTAVNVPTQVSLFWCNASFTVLSLAANLTAGSGTVTDTLDLSALTPPVGATGFLLVSGDATDIDNVATWQQANFS